VLPNWAVENASVTGAVSLKAPVMAATMSFWPSSSELVRGDVLSAPALDASFVPVSYTAGDFC
jgi:hypothetical protein